MYRTLTLFVCLYQLAAPSFANEKPVVEPGGREGVGGDPLLAEFVSRAHYLYKKIRLLSGDHQLLSLTELAQFKTAIKDTRVELVDKKQEDPQGGGLVTSIVIDDPENPGKKLIRIFRDYLKEVLSGTTKVNFNRYVLHEYLRVIGKDNNYQISGQVDLDGLAIREAVTKKDITFCESVSSGISLIDATVSNEEMKKTMKKKFLARKRIWLNSIEERIREMLNPSLVYLDFYAWGEKEQFRLYTEPLRNPSDPFGYEGDAPLRFVAAEYYNHQCTRIDMELPSDWYIEDSDDPIKGKEVSYASVSAGGAPELLVKAHGEALQTYAEACQTWKDGLKTELGGRLVFADCGVQSVNQKKRPSSKEKNPDPAKEEFSVQVFSKGKSYITRRPI